jgi:hypothetical protein
MVMVIPVMILPSLASLGGEDFAGVAAAVAAAAAAAFGVEDSALEELLAEGGERPADKRGTRG